MSKEYLLKKLKYSIILYIISCILTSMLLYFLSSLQQLSGIVVLLFCGIFSALTTYFKRRNEINIRGNEFCLNKKMNWMIILSILLPLLLSVSEILIYIY
ncbi:hypothetical protein DYZ95_01405 [Apilactobacillus timberlakei]|nr:hypothetical protein DYZ95_01405 [Apilactobacillus timberlakei]